MHGPSFALGRWRKEQGKTLHVPLAETICAESYAEGFAAGERRPAPAPKRGPTQGKPMGRRAW